MGSFWLKMIGTSKQRWPVNKSYDRKFVGFRHRKPRGIRAGDQMVLYAVGAKRIFALVKVTKECYDNDQEPGWPYRLDIEWPLEFGLTPEQGVDIDEVDPTLK